MFGSLLYPKVFRRRRKPVSRTKSASYASHKEFAREVVTMRIAELAPLLGVTPKRIAIRDTKRNWGSCSSLGNLNFNYKVALLPPCLRDYIIIHELCHLVHLHHKASYWAMVATYCPLYEERIRVIRKLEQVTRMQPVAIKSYTATHVCSYCLEQKHEVTPTSVG